MKKILFTILLGISISFFAKAQSAVTNQLYDVKEKKTEIEYFEGSLKELKLLAKNENKPFYVEFYADWCEPCKDMQQMTWSDQTIVNYVNKHFIACRINGEKDKGAELAKELNLEYYPTIIFFDAQGNRQGEALAFQRSDQLLPLLEKYAPQNAIQQEKQGIQFFEGTWSELARTAKKLGKPFFVDFYADWCGPCKAMDKQTFTNAIVGDFANEHFIPVQINAEEGEGLELAEKYKVKSYPTIMFFDAKGKEIGREMGFRNANDFLLLLNKYERMVNTDAIGVQFFEGTWQELLEEARTTGKPFFAFYTNSCAPCNTMLNNTFGDANVGILSNQNFIAYKIDAEKGEGIALSAEFQIRSYPTVVFYNSVGKIVGKDTFYQDADKFAYSMEKYLKKAKKK